MLSTFKPEFYFICQEYPSSSPFSMNYNVEVDSEIDAPVIHSNIYTGVAPGEQGIEGLIKPAGAQTLINKPLTSNAKPVRLINIKAEIYEKGHAATDEPLAVIETTKGE